MTPEGDIHAPPVSPLRHLVVVGFLAFVAFLVVRTHVETDDRWGFSMFRDITLVTVDYEWVYPEGKVKPVKFDTILYGDGRMMQTRRRPIDWVLGIGAYRDMEHQVVEELGVHHLPDGATGVRATLRWQLWGEGEWVEEVYAWPR